MKTDYICRKRAKFNALCGRVNIPYGTIVSSESGFLFLDGSPICTETSQTAHDFFCRADDGNGLERGKLISQITETLEQREEYDTENKYQQRWDKVWADKLCQKYKRRDHADHWLWNNDFYSAPIDDLRYIAALIKEV